VGSKCGKALDEQGGLSKDKPRVVSIMIIGFRLLLHPDAFAKF